MSINRDEVGVHVNGTTIDIGVYLPGVTAQDGFSVVVRLIHALDRFVPEIPSVPLPLTFDANHALGLWKLSVDLATIARPSGSHMGTNGQYFYRFELRRNNQTITRVFLDPFATENGPGLLGAFTVGPRAPFSWTDGRYRTPALDDLI